MIYVTGGCNYENITKAKTFRYDSIEDTWDDNHSMPDLNKSRGWHGSCAVGRRLFVFGGYDEEGYELDSIERLEYGKPESAWMFVTVDGFTARY